MDYSKKYEAFLNKIPRRTNECWFGSIETGVISVYGHNFLLYLDGTSLRIWNLIDGNRTMNDLIDQLCMEYSASRKNILKDTVNFVIHLENAGVAVWRTRPLFEDVNLDD